MNFISRALTIALLATVVWAANEALPTVGQQAPSFSLPSQDGSIVRLADFKGKYVVLYFYPKDGTPGCTMEAHNFQRDLPKYEAAGAVILGVSVDSADRHQKFCAQQSLTFKLLSDPDAKLVETYGSKRSILGITIAARNTFLIDPQGKIIKEWTGVKPAHHSEEVLAALLREYSGASHR